MCGLWSASANGVIKTIKGLLDVEERIKHSRLEQITVYG
jgi:hypothetical protein